MTDKQKTPHWRVEQILRTIEIFSDREFQERIWRLGLGPEVSSYDEEMCGFFDDVEGDALPQTRPRSTPEVLDHPDWPKVREIAKDTLRYFRNKTLFSA